MLHSISDQVDPAPTDRPPTEDLAASTTEMVFGDPDLQLPAPSGGPGHREPVPSADVDHWEPPTLELLERIREGLLQLQDPAAAQLPADRDHGESGAADRIREALGELPPPSGPRVPIDVPGAGPHAPAQDPDWRVGWSGPAGLPLRARGARVIEQLAAAPDDVMLTRIAAEMLLYGTHVDLLLTGMRGWVRDHPRPEDVGQPDDDASTPVLASSAVAW